MAPEATPKGDEMADFGFHKVKSMAPYAFILYLLLGGSGLPEFSGYDQQAATYVVGQVEENTPAKGMRDLYFEYVPSELPGLKEKNPPNLPNNSVGTFIRRAMKYPMSVLQSAGGTNYGY